MRGVEGRNELPRIDQEAVSNLDTAFWKFNLAIPFFAFDAIAGEYVFGIMPFVGMVLHRNECLMSCFGNLVPESSASKCDVLSCLTKRREQ